ncbi:MAG: GtrA family protein [Halobacteriovoraceae bacterium]|jgi:putative flippase GtrA|nr:GtrA family protein [Halobacteriovoraceae bacterium]
MHSLKIELSKFTVIGAINFIFTFILFFWMVKIIEVNYLIALPVVSVIGMVLTYTLNYVWVFKPEGKLVFRGRLIKYILAGSVSVSLNLIALKFLVDRTGFDPFYTQISLIPFIVVFNFLTAKFWSLRPVTF